jgi:hypothetical protein
MCPTANSPDWTSSKLTIFIARRRYHQASRAVSECSGPVADAYGRRG